MLCAVRVVCVLLCVVCVVCVGAARHNDEEFKRLRSTMVHENVYVYVCMYIYIYIYAYMYIRRAFGPRRGEITDINPLS